MASLMIQMGKPQVGGFALRWLHVVMLEFGSVSRAQILPDDWHSSTKVKHPPKEKDQGRQGSPVLAVRGPVIPSFSLLGGSKLRFRDLCRTWLFSDVSRARVHLVCEVKWVLCWVGFVCCLT